MVQINLTAAEENYCQTIGIKRNQSFENRGGLMDYSKSMNGGERGHILGFKCELAVAKFLGIVPEDIIFDDEKWRNRKNICDLGKNIEVRGTELLGGRLIIKPSDKDNAAFVLVIKTGPTYKLIGWLYGYDGKQKKYVSKTRHGQEMFFIPQSDLKPMSELKFIK